MIENFDVLRYLESLDIEPDMRSKGNFAYIFCPECDSDSPKLWINVSDSGKRLGAWRCWRNPTHRGGPVQLIQHLEGVSWRVAQERIKEFSTRFIMDEVRIMEDLEREPEEEEDDFTPVEIEYPTNCIPVIRSRSAMNYLLQRGISREKSVRWGLRYCSTGIWREQKFRYRIILPVFFQAQLVAFQGRDITGQAFNPYISSAADNGSLPVNRFLLNVDRVKRKGILILTEGYFDAMAVGDDCGSSLFGKTIYPSQAKMIADIVRPEILVAAFDADVIEKEQIVMNLMGLAPRLMILDLPEGEDPASLGYSKFWEIFNSQL